MKENNTLVGLLGVTSTIKGFKFNERKFLNGLTQREFMDITDRIIEAKKPQEEYQKAQQQYKQIITELKAQKDNDIKCPAYIGPTEDAEFNINAAFIKYDPQIKAFLEKYKDVTIPFEGARNIGSAMIQFLYLNLGKTKITTPSDMDRDHPGSGRVLIEDINNHSIDDPEVLEALFKSFDHSAWMDSKGPRTSIAYGIIPKIHEIGQPSMEKQNLFYIPIEKNKQAQIYLIKVNFSVKGSIQYRFAPLLDPCFDLDKFGFRYSSGIMDINLME